MQLSFLDILEGENQKSIGIHRALKAADRQIPGWKDKCWKLFVEWIGRKPVGYEFMTEDFRTEVVNLGLLENPKDLRAFGFLSPKAERNDLIENAGTSKTKNKKAHRTPAGVWRVIG